MNDHAHAVPMSCHSRVEIRRAMCSALLAFARAVVFVAAELEELLFWHPTLICAVRVRSAVYKDGKVCISILHEAKEDRFNELEKISEKWRPIIGVRCALQICSLSRESLIVSHRLRRCLSACC